MESTNQDAATTNAPDESQGGATVVGAATPAITHDAELSPAGTNPDGSHAVIPNAHASFLTRLAAAVKRGEQDAGELVRAIERVFGHVGRSA